MHNEDTYPNLVDLFRELGVRTQPSEMSFSVACERHHLEYSGNRPPLSRLDVEIVRFLRAGIACSTTRATRIGASRAMSDEERYSTGFRDHFLVPLCAALWSTAPSQTLDFPLVYAIRFLSNHGILGFRRLPWKTVTGGSQTYVRALSERLRISLSTRFARSAAATEASTCGSRVTRCGASTASWSQPTPNRP